MAKKKARPKVNAAVKEEQVTKPIRLDLSVRDHERIERSAKRFGLSKSAYARMAVFKQLEADEAGGNN
jgi:hypothetical protein